MAGSSFAGLLDWERLGNLADWLMAAAAMSLPRSTGADLRSKLASAVGGLTTPHNQTIAVRIQLGGMGIVALWTMWIAQLQLCRRPGLAVRIGLAIVIQNVVRALFSSLAFDFTGSWIGVIAIAAGLFERERESVGVARTETATAAVQKA